MKKNNLRKKYAIYSMIIGELFAVTIIICSGYLTESFWQLIFRIAGIAATVLIPLSIYWLYRLRGRDNAATSDELEQMVLQKAFALAGVVAVSLLPFLLLLCCMFNSAAGYIAIVYGGAVGGTMKMAALYYNRKY